MWLKIFKIVFALAAILILGYCCFEIPNDLLIALPLLYSLIGLFVFCVFPGWIKRRTTKIHAEWRTADPGEFEQYLSQYKAYKRACFIPAIIIIIFASPLLFFPIAIIQQPIPPWGIFFASMLPFSLAFGISDYDFGFDSEFNSHMEVLRKIYGICKHTQHYQCAVQAKINRSALELYNMRGVLIPREEIPHFKTCVIDTYYVKEQHLGNSNRSRNHINTLTALKCDMLFHTDASNIPFYQELFATISGTLQAENQQYVSECFEELQATSKLLANIVLAQQYMDERQEIPYIYSDIRVMHRGFNFLQSYQENEQIFGWEFIFLPLEEQDNRNLYHLTKLIDKVFEFLEEKIQILP